MTTHTPFSLARVERAFARSPIASALLVVMVLAVASSSAFANGYGRNGTAAPTRERVSMPRPDWRKLAGWEYFKAPTTTNIAAYTAFGGTRDELAGQPLDSWLGFVNLTAELEIIKGKASVWGEMGYIGMNETGPVRGWTDLIAGLKLTLIESGPLMVSAYGGPRLSIGSDGVSAPYSQVQAGVSMSLMFADVFGFNTGLDASLLWNLPASDDNQAFLGRVFLEFALVPLDMIQARVGIVGQLQQNSTTIEEFEAYVEGRASFLFARASFPFDFSSGANVNADMVLTTGITFGF